jgi:hypothetical protein
MHSTDTTFNPVPRLLASGVLILLWTAFFIVVLFPRFGWGSFWTHWEAFDTPAYHRFLSEQWSPMVGILLCYLSPLVLMLWLFAKAIPVRTQRFKVLRGLVYVRDTHDALASARYFTKTTNNTRGAWIHPALCLPSLEKGVLLCGARGSGKTQVMLQLLMPLLKHPPAQRRERRIVLFDEPGDYTELLPTEDFILLAPWHAQGVWWDLAADLTTLSQARLFAAQFIAPAGGGENPMWAKGARQVLVGILNYLIQRDEPIRFTRLLELFTLQDAALMAILQQGNPEACRTLGELVENTRFNRTGQSFIATLSAYMAPITDLAFAWQSLQHQAERRFSLREYLADEWQGPELLVIQGSKEHGELARALAAAMISLLSNTVCSPTFPQVTSRKQPYDLYCFLDEVAQLGKVPELEDLISLGRKKGVRPILGVQDIAKIVDIYGPNLAKVWAGQFGAYYIGQVGLGDTAQWISRDVIGHQEIEYLAGSETLSPSGGSSSISLQRREQPVMLPSQLASELGVTADRKHFRGVVFVTGTDRLLRLEWPIARYPLVRQAVVPNPDLARSDFARLNMESGQPEGDEQVKEDDGDAMRYPPL